MPGTLNARLTFQDARVFGETDTKQPATATTGSVGIYEAWAELSPVTAVQVAWCAYFANKGTDLLKYKKTTVDTKIPQYAYLMLTIKPQFYKTPSAETKL